MGQPLRILLVEDSEEDAELLLLELRRGGYEPVAQRVDSGETMAAALEKQCWDLVISDYVMPGFGGLQALALFHQRGLDLPFIVVSGHIGEEIAVAAMQAGADDYLMKDRLARLVPAIQRALQKAEIRRAHQQANQALRESEERFRQLAGQLQTTVDELRVIQQQLRNSNAELSQARAELERRVRERTAALAAANAELHEQMDERKRLENELLEIAENERRRIGFDLHDDLGQKLMGVSLLLKALETNLGHQRLPEAAVTRNVQVLVQQMIQHTHNLARCFSSFDALNENLLQQLKTLAATVRKTFPIVCRFRSVGAMPAFPADVTLQLYKIAQESISNAIKHGKATHISVRLSRRGAQVILRIENDGVPFQVEKEPTNRLGLRIMNYRAHLAGGVFEIQPNGKCGTLVTCTINLPNGTSKPSLAASRRMPDSPASHARSPRLPEIAQLPLNGSRPSASAFAKSAD
jgi:signal transduction histidine kinase